MSVHNLDALFNPVSVAVIGASNRPGSLGQVVFRNALRGGFEGRVLPVHPRYPTVQSVVTYPDVESLPDPVDLAVVCTPPDTVPGIVTALADRGARAAIVLTAGLSRPDSDPDHGTLEKAMLAVARETGLRILGPNCLGVMVPGSGLNCSFAHLDALPGRLAFLSQSGALCTAVLDWARSAGVGFSHFVSLGNSADIDVGDLLDYLGGHAGTSAILMYIESVVGARKFISAARAAARNKPVLVVKAGRETLGAAAATSHTGALAGSDEVFDAAVGRTGMLRVLEVADLFDAVESLARPQIPRGDRLAILTNGGGLGVMAVDALAARGGRLAQLAPETVEKLDVLLPDTWPRTNPVDMIGDASAERYARALPVLLEAPEVDAVLVLHTPTAMLSSAEAAAAVAHVVGETHPTPSVYAGWLGDSTAQEGRARLREAGVPTYTTPEDAARSFLRVVRYRRNQELLAETPPSVLEGFVPDVATARLRVEEALDGGRTTLSEPESKAVLKAFGIPVVETRIAGDAQAAVAEAEALGFPVAVKLLSPDVSHKSDVGGVMLDLGDSNEVLAAARAIESRFRRAHPEGRLEGFTVQPMTRRPGAHELILGVATDPVFGPVLLFGEGGTAVELIGDKAVALPPLNAKLARELMSRTRIHRLLQGYRGRPAANLDAVVECLIKLSQLVVDLPEVVELDVNPLLADATGAVALDARISVRRRPDPPGPRLAIRPYPRELEEEAVLANGLTILMRPIRPEDEPAHRALFESFTQEDIRSRFFGLVREMPHSQLARYTQIDYEREMAFIAVDPAQPGTTLGVVRVVSDSGGSTAEFAIIVRSGLGGKGLGTALMEKIIRYCRGRGMSKLVGEVLPGNVRMLTLARALGFTESRPTRSEDPVRVTLQLQQPHR